MKIKYKNCNILNYIDCITQINPFSTLVFLPVSLRKMSVFSL